MDVHVPEVLTTWLLGACMPLNRSLSRTSSPSSDRPPAPNTRADGCEHPGGVDDVAAGRVRAGAARPCVDPRAAVCGFAAGNALVAAGACRGENPAAADGGPGARREDDAAGADGAGGRGQMGGRRRGDEG
eukprot:355732-Chlamydomonas_euryale.AAC.6